MKIENLKVNGFGKLENKEINFSNGINVIQGNNEAGKSTLLKFITSMFYGTARNKKGRDISDFEKYKPWGKEEYSGKITYTLDNNEEYEVYREFKKKSPIIYDEQKNDITKNYQIDKNKDSMFFIEQTGITEENFFASCVAEQEGVRLSANMKNSIIQKLSNIVSSGSENISYKKTLDKLNKRQLEEIGSSRSTGRPLNVVEEEIERKEAEKKEIEIYKDKKYQVENEKEDIKTNLQENKATLDLLRQQKINLEKTQLEKEKIKIFEQALEKDEESQEKIKKKIEEEREAFENCSEEIKFDKLHYDSKKWNLLSLFSGCGGLDLGFELAGLQAVMGKTVMEEAFRDKKVFDKNINNNVFNTIYVNDIFDEARETYAQNAGKYIYMDKSDIRKIKEFPKADIVLGGFPCPGFSEAGPRLVDDKRNFLYLHFIRCLMQSKPKIFVAENVKGMMTLGKGEVFKQIVQDFAAAGYKIYHKLLNSAEYGVPQIRERVILVGVRNDIDFEYVYPKPTHGYGVNGLEEVVTLHDAIGDLEENPGEYFVGSYSTIFMSRNRKKLWSQPSFTIQASGRQAPIHPGGEPMVKVGKDKYIFSDGEENNRRLSVKEIARIQTFPDWYEFSRGTSNRNANSKLDLVYKQIGNAVPVRLALAVAEPIAEFAKEQLEKEEKAYVVVRNVGENKRMMA